AGLHERAVKSLPKALGLTGVLAPNLTDVIGNSGTAHGALVLTDVLDRAEPGQHILVVSVADGADAIVLRTTAAITDYRAATAAHYTTHQVAAQVARGDLDLPYAMFLTWRGYLHREPPRREEPDRPMSPVMARRDSWKFGLVGSTCTACGTRNMSPQRVCFSCQAVDEMEAECFADVPATITTFTID
ncbi:MAG TPA: hydroxymethylglutaryl-CoA synthase, partial [Ilumatobacteraceae bacterium]|nr:hydroxymethylglutaryl-CoA synthase [Ilumatobacteraceae bacterium]